MKYEMKPLFKERLQQLMPDTKDFESFSKIIHTSPRNFIRCNTLKIAPAALLARLQQKWLVTQPFDAYPHIMLIQNTLGPGELGNAREHLLGYYYIQEISSMLSILALTPEPNERVLDLCASPGSKTSQMAAAMQNTGTLIANDIKLDRISILAANLERCGVSNAIITRNDAVALCARLHKKKFLFDRILLDAPCSGEGTLRSSPKTLLMWNPKVIDNLSRQQKKLIAYAVKCLTVGGTLVYSTCTHAPEENEGVVDFALKNFPLELQQLQLPLKTRPGITYWDETQYNPQVEKCCRIYPQDNDSEGFFVAKFKLTKEINHEKI